MITCVWSLSGRLLDINMTRHVERPGALATGLAAHSVAVTCASLPVRKSQYWQLGTDPLPVLRPKSVDC